MGAKKEIIRAWIKHTIAYCPGQFTCDMCRQLNGITEITYCNDKSCYANSRKRARGGIQKCSCKFSLQLVAYHLKKMVSQGLLTFTKEKRTDNYQSRGWDLYTCYYAV